MFLCGHCRPAGSGPRANHSFHSSLTEKSRRMRLQLNRNLGLMLLGVWLVLYGLSAFGLNFPGLSVVLGILAIVAGLIILVGR
jgi:hypothetical protein